MKYRSCLANLLCSAMLLVCAFNAAAYAQRRGDPTSDASQRARQDAERRSVLERTENLNRLRETAHDAQPGPRRIQRHEYSLTAADKKLLAPSAEDINAYTAFLRQPQTGILRLVPAAEGRVINASEVETGKPGVLYNNVASCYSFSKSKYNCDRWSDIGLKGELFRTGIASESLGLLINLGDVPIESVTLQTPGASQLAALVAPSDYDSAAQQYKQNSAGFRIASYSYRSFLPAMTGKTYALRSTSYHRKDVLVVFRVIRRDEDGIITIVWKRLKADAPPELKGEPKK